MKKWTAKDQENADKYRATFGPGGTVEKKTIAARWLLPDDKDAEANNRTPEQHNKRHAQLTAQVNKYSPGDALHTTAKYMAAAYKQYHNLEGTLKGNQHKIDANKNGKIDAHDFELLRRNKKLKEEIEQIDEVTFKKLEKYLKPAVTAHGMATTAARNSIEPDEKQHWSDIAKRRKRGIRNAINKLDAADGREPENPVKVPAKGIVKEASEEKLRSYISKALDKWIGEAKVGSGKYDPAVNNEEVQQINELKAKTLASYADKAVDQLRDVDDVADKFADNAKYMAKHGDREGAQYFAKKAVQHISKSANRRAGIKLATKKLAQKAGADDLFQKGDSVRVTNPKATPRHLILGTDGDRYVIQKPNGNVMSLPKERIHRVNKGSVQEGLSSHEEEGV